MRDIINKIVELESYEKVIIGLCGSFIFLMIALVILNGIKF